MECVVILANFQAIPNVPYKNSYEIQLLLSIFISLVFTLTAHVDYEIAMIGKHFFKNSQFYSY